MKTRPALCSAHLALVLLLAAAAAAPGGEPEGEAAPAPWEEQLTELGFQLFRNSNVNVVNGLNLTREQASKLRELAEKAERRGIRKPDPRGPLSPELQEVKDAFSAARKVLMAGGEVTAELEASILKARALESRILREGLRFEPRRRSCARCHASPGERGPFRPWNWGALPPHGKKMMAEDHVNVFGTRGAVTLYLLGREIDAILTPGQKSVLSHFSCCLLPPKDLSEPVRVGQASAAAWQVEMLEKARQCPGALWPFAKKKALDRIVEARRIADPGLTALQGAAVRKRVGDVMEKARSMAEFDFEMEKEKLCDDLGLGPADTPDAPEHVRCFMGAFFLLFPGSVEAYDAYLKRLDARTEARPADLEKLPGAGEFT